MATGPVVPSRISVVGLPPRVHVGLHGPGVKIPLFLQDWELAKVAQSFQMALDML